MYSMMVSNEPCGACGKPSLAFNCGEDSWHYRHDEDASKWHWAKGSSAAIFSPVYPGEPSEQGGTLIICEGESDAIALHACGFNAIGILGANNIPRAIGELQGSLKGLDFIIMKEADRGGKAFEEGARSALATLGHRVRVSEYALESDARTILTRHAVAAGVTFAPAFGGTESFIKFCSALANGDARLAKVREAARSEFAALMRDARSIGVAVATIESPTTASVAGSNEIPAGWRVDEFGVHRFAGEDEGYRLVLPARLGVEAVEVDAHSGREELRLAWQRGSREWVQSVPRATAASAQRIVELADDGLPVTSANARGVVEFLGAVEALNFAQLPRETVTRIAGWHKGHLHHQAELLRVNEDTGSGRMLSGLVARGSGEEAEEGIRRTLIDHPVAAFLIGASAAAPMLQMVGLRGFAVHVWGDSMGGKTAAVKLAASVWGDPARLMTSWAASPSAIEATAATMQNLPLVIDELQAAESRDHVARTMYMLTNGVGRARATVTGELGAQRTWLTTVLTTGEEPLLADDANDGARNRLIEINAAPFAGEAANAAAAAAHDLADRCYGWIGRQLVDQPVFSPANWGRVREDHDSATGALREAFGDALPPIKLRSVALVTVALQMLHDYLNIPLPAINTVRDVIKQSARDSATVDANQPLEWKARDAILTLFATRSRDLTPDSVHGQIGAIVSADEVGGADSYYLTPAGMREAAKIHSIPPRRITQLLFAAGVIDSETATVRRWRGPGTSPSRVFKINTNKLNNSNTPEEIV